MQVSEVRDSEKMINRDHPLLITKQASLVNISRRSVYYEPKPVSNVDLVLMRKMMNSTWNFNLWGQE